MAHAIEHAKNTVARWGGKVEDYLAVHQWLDASKLHYADVRHRALRHHTAGIGDAEVLFGILITNSLGKEVPVRYICEQHIKEDLGRIPSLQDWYEGIQVQPWMLGQRLVKEEKL